MDVFCGTSGFNYGEWKGVFYPDDLPNDAMLGHYASQLPAVEINNTFYRVPKKAVVLHWEEQVPDGFRFAIKASRRVTHFKKLADADEPLGFVLRSVEYLGAKLGGLLFQLPPYLRKEADRLSAFQQTLPEGLPAAFEFRHDSWFDAEITELLRAHNHTLVISETEENRLPDLPDTADWGYLRLRRPAYTDAELEEWRDRLQEKSWQRVMVFFKHETEGAGPAMAARFQEMLAG